jgi:hypothetical protein
LIQYVLVVVVLTLTCPISSTFKSVTVNHDKPGSTSLPNDLGNPILKQTRSVIPTSSHMYLAGVIISDPLEATTTIGITSCVPSRLLLPLTEPPQKYPYGCAPLAGNRAPDLVLLDYVNIREATAALNNLPSMSTSATSTAMSASALVDCPRFGLRTSQTRCRPEPNLGFGFIGNAAPEPEPRFRFRFRLGWHPEPQCDNGCTRCTS